MVHAIPGGHFGDPVPDARFVDIQTDDEGTHHQDVVPVDAPHGGAEIAALYQR